MKAPEQHLLLQLLTLNIFHTTISYYTCYYWIRTKINSVWVWQYIVSDNEFVFSNCEKYIFLWVGKFCRATCFCPDSPKIRLQEDNFSQQHFRKVSQTQLHFRELHELIVLCVYIQLFISFSSLKLLLSVLTVPVTS